MDDFHLINLVSQGAAVQKLLEGMTQDEKLSWFANHGRIEEMQMSTFHPEQKRVYQFESAIGIETRFFFDGDMLVFMGDHTTFTVDELD